MPTGESVRLLLTTSQDSFLTSKVINLHYIVSDSFLTTKPVTLITLVPLRTTSFKSSMCLLSLTVILGPGTSSKLK